MSRLMLLMAAGASLLSAQPTTSGPSLGFVFDSRAQALRPVLGIPGASLFGDPLNPTTAISSAAISDNQALAIVNDGAWKAVVLSGASPSATVLPDGLPATARLAVSETGTAAAFYDGTNNALSVVSGIGGTATLASVDLSALPGNITAFAVADDGSLLLSSAVSGGGESLFWIAAGGGMQQLASLQGAAAIRIWGQGANALVVDRAANQVWQIQNPGNNPAITLAASETDGVSSPSGAAVSSDGRLWITNSATRTVLGVNLSTRATVSLSCSFDPKTVTPTGDGQTFRLNRPDHGPLWLLDATPGADPRVVFVPASVEATQ